jgi:cell division protein FtsZ
LALWTTLWSALLRVLHACNHDQPGWRHARITGQETKMSINLGPSSIEELRPRITVIGVGGAGGNAIANMIEAKIEGVDFVVANTDAQALNNSVAEQRIQLGPDITQGLGAGSGPEVGRAAAEETLAEIDRILDGTHMVFIAAGMGGGTGTGAAPIIAKAARDKGVLTVGVVTKPFLFEGTRRMRAAETGIEELQQHVDTLIVIPNQNLFLIAKAETTFKEAFQLADEVLQQGVRSITDLMVMPGLINLDFADVRSVMGEMGKAMMGTGEGEGENRALSAAEKAIANPLLDGVSMQGARGVIISIIGGEDMKLLEVDEAANHIRELVDPDANIIWGSAFNPDLNGKIRVSVVATGIEQASEAADGGARPLNLTRARGPALPLASVPASNDVVAPPPVAAAPTPIVFEREEAPLAPEPEAAQDDADDPEPFDLDDGQIVDEAGKAPGEAAVAETAAEPETAPERESAYASLTGLVRTPREAPLELDIDQVDEAAPAARQDELLLDADRRSAQDDDGDGASEAQADDDGAAGRLPSSGEDAPPAERPAAAAGSTLFERMANLSRSKPASDEEEDETPSSISIPRFLGRQNNQ